MSRATQLNECPVSVTKSGHWMTALFATLPNGKANQCRKAKRAADTKHYSRPST